MTERPPNIPKNPVCYVEDLQNKFNFAFDQGWVCKKAFRSKQCKKVTYGREKHRKRRHKRV